MSLESILNNKSYFFSPYLKMDSLQVGNGLTPADYGMGLFNMPVMPMNTLNTNNIFSNLQNNNFTLPQTMGGQNIDWGQALSAMASMQNAYVDNWMNAMKNQFGIVLNNSMQPYSDLDTVNCSKSAEELQAKWAKKKPTLSKGFYNKVVSISERIGCSPDALMALMNSESGINTKAVNTSGGATGLIQFMPSTARSLGTSTEALKWMSPEQQLVYVEKYLMNAKRSAGYKDNEKIDAGTLYALVFLPGRARNYVLTRAGEKYYEAGSNYRLGSNGQITKADLARRLEKFSA